MRSCWTVRLGTGWQIYLNHKMNFTNKCLQLSDANLLFLRKIKNNEFIEGNKHVSTLTFCVFVIKQSFFLHLSSDQNRKRNNAYYPVTFLTCVILHREIKWCVFCFLGHNCGVNRWRNFKLIRNLTACKHDPPHLLSMNFLSNLWHDWRHTLRRVVMWQGKFEAQDFVLTK